MSHDPDDLYNELQDMHERVTLIEMGQGKAASLVEAVNLAAKRGRRVEIEYERVDGRERLTALILPPKQPSALGQVVRYATGGWGSLFERFKASPVGRNLWCREAPLGIAMGLFGALALAAWRVWWTAP